MVGRGMDGQCKIPDKLWEQVEPLLPPIPPDARKAVLSLIVEEQWKPYSVYFAPEVNGGYGRVCI